MVSDYRRCRWEAIAYITNRGVLLHPIAIGMAPDGWRYFMEPLVSLQTGCSTEELGAAVRQVLDLSTIDAEPQPNRRDRFSAVYEAAGFTDCRQFVQNSRYCSISRRTNPAAIEIVPTRNGTGTWIEDGEVRYALLERSLKLSPEVSDCDLGKALLRCFEACE